MSSQTLAILPQIDRDQWERHPKYPAQVLLLGSHANFRRINAWLTETARRDARPERLEVHFRSWIAAMRSHEAYEEHKLYPYLTRRWGIAFDAAVLGHRRLHDRFDDVIAAFRGLVGAAEERASRDALVAALEAHETTLREHLQIEEDLVIPALLSLEADEFQRYCDSSIERLLQTLG